MPLALCCGLACALLSAPPPPSTVPDAAAAAAAPLDDERPDATGLGLERRMHHKMEKDTGLDLADAWDDYEEDYKEDGERRSFARYTEQRLRNRRGGGIGLTIGGVVFTGLSSIFWVYVVGGAEYVEGQAVFGVLAVGVTAIGITGIGLGARIWSRNQQRLNTLRDAGYLAGGPRLRLQAVTPLVVPHGGGLGLRLAF